MIQESLLDSLIPAVTPKAIDVIRNSCRPLGTTIVVYIAICLHMWPDLQKPDIMAHTKIFSITHYKNLVQKNAFNKILKVNFQRPYKLELVEPRQHCVPYHVRSTKIFESFMYSSTTSVSSRAVKNGNYLSISSH